MNGTKDHYHIETDGKGSTKTRKLPSWFYCPGIDIRVNKITEDKTKVQNIAKNPNVNKVLFGNAYIQKGMISSEQIDLGFYTYKDHVEETFSAFVFSYKGTEPFDDNTLKIVLPESHEKDTHQEKNNTECCVCRYLKLVPNEKIRESIEGTIMATLDDEGFY